MSSDRGYRAGRPAIAAPSPLGAAAVGPEGRGGAVAQSQRGGGALGHYPSREAWIYHERWRAILEARRRHALNAPPYE